MRVLTASAFFCCIACDRINTVRRCFGISIAMHQLNEEIRDKELRLIGSGGEQLGIMSASEALRIAEEKGLDLVKISPRPIRRCAS